MFKINVRSITFTAMFTALSIVFTRVFAIINTDTLRLTIGNVPIMLAGIFFGPVAGALCGALSDILGCLLIGGYMPYLPMTLSPILIGVLPGVAAILAKSRIKNGISNKLVLAATVIVTELIASFFWKSLCLSWLYGSPFTVLFAERVPLNLIQTAVEIILLYALLKGGELLKMFGKGKKGNK
jgi:ECF transporter S component (folate family)